MMVDYDWQFSRIMQYWPAFQNGIELTIYLSMATIIFSTVIGVGIGILMARSAVARLFLLPVVDTLKSLPPLVVVLFGYYFYTDRVIGVTLPAFWAFVFSLGFNVAAFIADLTRASLGNVPTEFVDTARSLGLSHRAVIRFVVAPWALRELLPPLSYLYIEAIKLTSLASIIAVEEVVYVAETVISETTRSLEAWVIVSVIYLVMIMPATIMVRRIEKRQKEMVGIFN